MSYTNEDLALAIDEVGAVFAADPVRYLKLRTASIRLRAATAVQEAAAASLLSFQTDYPVDPVPTAVVQAAVTQILHLGGLGL